MMRVPKEEMKKNLPHNLIVFRDANGRQRAPIHLSSEGQFYVADEDAVIGFKGIRVTKSKALLGYILAQYIDGDEEEPTRSDCVDLPGTLLRPPLKYACPLRGWFFYKVEKTSR